MVLKYKKASKGTKLHFETKLETKSCMNYISSTHTKNIIKYNRRVAAVRVIFSDYIVLTI